VNAESKNSLIVVLTDTQHLEIISYLKSQGAWVDRQMRQYLHRKSGNKNRKARMK